MQGAEILTKFTADDSQVKQATKSVSKEFDLLAAAGVAAFSKIGYEFNAMIINFVKGGIEYNSQIEDLTAGLYTLTGSTEEADKILKQIKEDALTTPFDVASLTEAESMLLAAGISAEDARKDILALGDAVASTPKGGNVELQRMAYNLQQIKNQGKATSIDIRQFATAGIPIYSLLAESMGKTTQEIVGMDISYEDLSKALNRANKEGGRFYGAMERKSKTLSGATSNLKESWSVLKGELAQGVFEAVKDLIPKLTELFNWIAQNKDIIIAIVVPILTFTNVLLGLMIIKGIAAGFIALWTAISMNPISITIALLTGLGATFVILYNKFDWFKNMVDTVWAEIKTSFQSAVLFIEDTLIGQLVGVGINTLVNELKGVLKFITGVFTGDWKRAWEGICDIFTSVFDGIKNMFKSVINWIIDKFNWFIEQVNKIKFPDWEWLGSLAGKGFDFKPLTPLATGTNYVPQDMLAVIHEGEAVVPKKFNPYANGINTNSIANMGTLSPIINITINNDMEMDTLGQIVNKVKTYSGGAKNDYNYGMGGR